jgi:hypothetical protein
MLSFATVLEPAIKVIGLLAEGTSLCEKPQRSTTANDTYGRNVKRHQDLTAVFMIDGSGSKFSFNHKFSILAGVS